MWKNFPCRRCRATFRAVKTPALKTVVRKLLRIFLIAFATAVIGLLLLQHSLIYHPRQYANYAAQLPKNAVELKYNTAQGAQLSFYIPPRSNAREPDRVWVLFCGNASLALDWTDFLAQLPQNNDAFLLVEYPGYGRCEGTPNPAPIGEAAEKAFLTLAAALHLEPAQLDAKINVLGHSLGCATALQFAAHHPVRRVVLLAPFTCLRDMARRTVGFPLNWVLLHNFDNRARLAELAARTEPPRVTIIHAADDQVIPNAMGRELAGMFPKMIRFRQIEDADHDSILHLAHDEILEAMKD